GFRLRGLRSELFDPVSTPLLSGTRLRNFALQRVIALLSLSKGDRNGLHRISYASLSTNELGEVYEGLLSYSGFFAPEPLVECKRAEDREDKLAPTYFVPESKLAEYGLKEEELVYREAADGTREPARYSQGAFIFRLRGRERQESASYYTPRELTETVVEYTLRELLPQLKAGDILRLRILEPALGSGAFLNAAVTALAREYLAKKEAELGQKVPEERRNFELARVRAYLAAKCVYGVDKNPVAIELAAVSLWLNTLHAGQAGPWYEARLAAGNSLVGARRAGYGAEALQEGTWSRSAPEGDLPALAAGEKVYHFLLPDPGMCAYEKDKAVKEAAKEELARIKAWKGGLPRKITGALLQRLQRLTKELDVLWNRAIKQRQDLLRKVDDDLHVWPEDASLDRANPLTAAQRREMLQELVAGDHSPYHAVNTVLNIWCALWFWPIEKADLLPSYDEWLQAVEELVAAVDVTTDGISGVKARHPWLAVVDEVAGQEHFFHWELAFGEVFAENGGFDIILGNPPWVPVEWKEADVLA
ncbi:MAG: hypothetical protein IMW99_11290, partial [Firmicutes bacterium]|nr:hypothetical protein [Bacillota bacterium]